MWLDWFKWSDNYESANNLADSIEWKKDDIDYTEQNIKNQELQLNIKSEETIDDLNESLWNTLSEEKIVELNEKLKSNALKSKTPKNFIDTVSIFAI